MPNYGYTKSLGAPNIFRRQQNCIHTYIHISLRILTFIGPSIGPHQLINQSSIIQIILIAIIALNLTRIDS